MKWKIYSLLALTFLAVGIMLKPVGCEAAVSEETTRQFIDSNNHMGYYVDTATINLENDHQFTADVQIIKPSENLLFVYKTHFDVWQHSYQYTNSKIYRYSTKELLSQNNNSGMVLTYMKDLPLKEVADFVSDWRRTH